MFTLTLGDDAQLRPLEPWHAQEFLAHIDRARPYVDPWIPWASFSTDLTSATAVLQRYADRQASDTGRIYGIWLDGTLVGGVMFTTFDVDAGVCEVGCWLEEAGAGRGLVTRAGRVLIDWAFKVRGMSRVEWWAASGNTRSIQAARRLGMTRDGVLRRRIDYRGERRDCEIWSVLAEEWPPADERVGERPSSGKHVARPAAQAPAAETPARADDKAELDELVRRFFGAFTNTGGTRPDVAAIREVFIPQGLITANSGGDPVVYDLDGFVEPREKMLTDGTLTEFSEWEVSERTEIFHAIAHRRSEYRKSGYLKGEWFEGSGRKTTQFVRTSAGWRMSAVSWEDDE
ncbi:N-acetyltransferase [Streptomyces antnestii]|uniref:N-acetyltransferase n=1 Tax=Streptomyces antnestii TaxID=2494256 RepID=A0A437Q0Z8_9ACTN|nr:GNAT family protein [Streptomyces sp. San01]RVU28194.1 N-acetyltransferase [Streptomyces sp. San01]